jgi:nucleoid DNA-binding protein
MATATATKTEKIEKVDTRDLVVTRLSEIRNIPTKKEAKELLNDVLSAITSVLETNITTDKFAIKLGDFGKFTVRHREGKMRKIPFTGETKMTKDRRKVKFTALGNLRKLEKFVTTE